MKNHMLAVFHGTRDNTVFRERLQAVINEVPSDGVFAGDNMFTFNRNLGFLDDERMMEAFEAHTETVIEKSLLWRYHVTCWNAKRALRLDGDLIECGCNRGIGARIIADYIDLEASSKAYYLYDRFEPPEEMGNHGTDLHAEVRARFADFSNVHIVKGAVPESLHQKSPEKIAFLHISLNNADAEVAALDVLFERIVPGGAMVLNDYGWSYYREQKLLEDAWLAERGYQVLELPTGQGLVIK